MLEVCIQSSLKKLPKGKKSSTIAVLTLEKVFAGCLYNFTNLVFALY